MATRLIIGTPAKPPAWRPLILADAGPGRMDAVATRRHPVEGVVVAAAQVDFHLDEGEEVMASVEPSGALVTMCQARVAMKTYRRRNAARSPAVTG